jgi:hypothetical protein
VPSVASLRSRKGRGHLLGKLGEAISQQLARGHHRAEAREEVLREAVGRVPLDRRRVALELQLAGRGEQVAHVIVILGAPEEGRLGEVRRRGHVRGAGAEHVAGRPLGRPAADRDQAAAAADPPQLVRGASVARREHVAERREDAIEAAVPEESLSDEAREALLTAFRSWRREM